MTHNYKATLEWSNPNNDLNVRSYSRNHAVTFEGKPTLQTSADPTFRGDKSLYNPEELLLGALSSCHMLSYLYRCAINGIVVTNYTDRATGVMETDGSGGKFTSVTLHPTVTVANESMVDQANELHHQANKDCFIANSVNFDVLHEATTLVATQPIA